MVSVAIMAHPKRAAFVDELTSKLPDAEVVWDRGEGRWETGRRSLLAYDTAADHHVIVQDDAIVCPDFMAAASEAVTAAGERPVSFYTGKPRPIAAKVAVLIGMARQASRPWIVMHGPIWGVAIAVPTACIDELVEWGDRHPEIPNYDMRISRYFQDRGVRCWYTAPSLVDHRPVSENPSLIAGRTANRRAHWFIGARSPLGIDWTRPPLADNGQYRRLERKGAMAQKRIANERIYGFDRSGRRVLVAAKGQPIPDWYIVEPPVAAESPSTYVDPRVELTALKRPELNARARAAGIDAPERLPNKAAVIEALAGA